MFSRCCTRLIGHRGFTPLAPENSLPGFAYAGRLGLWAIETDVRRTKDGSLVCLHEERVEGQYEGSGAVDALTLEELRPMRIRKSGATACFSDAEMRMPLLAEYLEICAKYHAVAFLETKFDGVEQVLREALKHLPVEQIVLSSLSLEHLSEARQRNQNVFIHHILSNLEHLETLASWGNSGMSFDIHEERQVPPGLVDRVHKEGVRVCFRAADSWQTAIWMKRIGLDYLPTNRLTHVEAE